MMGGGHEGAISDKADEQKQVSQGLQKMDLQNRLVGVAYT